MTGEEGADGLWPGGLCTVNQRGKMHLLAQRKDCTVQFAGNFSFYRYSLQAYLLAYNNKHLVLIPSPRFSLPVCLHETRDRKGLVHSKLHYQITPEIPGLKTGNVRRGLKQGPRRKKRGGGILNSPIRLHWSFILLSIQEHTKYHGNQHIILGNYVTAETQGSWAKKGVVLCAGRIQGIIPPPTPSLLRAQQNF